MKKRSPYWWSFVIIGSVVAVLGGVVAALYLGVPSIGWYGVIAAYYMLIGIKILWLVFSVWCIHKLVGIIRNRKNPESKTSKWVYAPICITLALNSVLLAAVFSPEYSYRRNERAIEKHAISPAEKERLQDYNLSARQAKKAGDDETLKLYSEKLRPYFKEKASKSRYKRYMAKLEKASSEKERFRTLGDAAKESLNMGKIGDAERYADELHGLLPKYEKRSGYANAKHDMNTVYGRLALQQEDFDAAKQYLLEAGRSSGSATLNSFGPSMALAEELIRRGEPEIVLEYFKLCSVFWKHGQDKLAQWEIQVEQGELPHFGASLIH